MTIEIRELIVQARVREDASDNVARVLSPHDEEHLAEKVKQQLIDWLRENGGNL